MSSSTIIIKTTMSVSTLRSSCNDSTNGGGPTEYYADLQAPRTVLRALRASSSRAAYRAPVSARAFSVSRAVREEAAAAPAEVSPKIKSIVDSVEGLTLLEVSELVTALKVSFVAGGREVKCWRDELVDRNEPSSVGSKQKQKQKQMLFRARRMRCLALQVCRSRHGARAAIVLVLGVLRQTVCDAKVLNF